MDHLKSCLSSITSRYPVENPGKSSHFLFKTLFPLCCFRYGDCLLRLTFELLLDYPAFADIPQHLSCLYDFRSMTLTNWPSTNVGTSIYLPIFDWCVMIWPIILNQSFNIGIYRIETMHKFCRYPRSVSTITFWDWITQFLESWTRHYLTLGQLNASKLWMPWKVEGYLRCNYPSVHHCCSGRNY